LNTTHLPRDASAILSGKLLHNDVNADENKFTEAHLLACERLQEHEEFANSEPRRLHSLALAPAFLFLLADMVEDADSSKTTSLFVEALNSKDHFFEIYCSNLVKSEEIIQAGMIRAGGMKRKVHEVKDEDAAIDGEPTLDEKLQMLMDDFKNTEMIEKNKFIRIVNKNSLAVAHTRLNENGKKGWSKLNISKKESGPSKNNGFIRDGVEELTDFKGDVYVTKVSKVFPLKNMSEDLKRKVKNVLSYDKDEDSEDEDIEENEYVTQSQDFPPYSQSKTSDTHVYCKSCYFQTRNKGEMKNHMKTHPRCHVCGVQCIDKSEQLRHIELNHQTFKCGVCRKDVKIAGRDEHMKSHIYDKAFEKGIKKGKVNKVKKVGSELEAEQIEKKDTKTTGYSIFRHETCEKLRGTKHRKGELMKAVNAEWAAAKKDCRNNAYEERAAKLTFVSMQ
jgi:hypothetical protein